MDLLNNKLVGWKKHSLFMAGQLTLIRSVAQAMTIQKIQAFIISKKILDNIDKRMRDFFWGFFNDQSHHLYLKAWSSMCIPKFEGGLGILDSLHIAGENLGPIGEG